MKTYEIIRRALIKLGGPGSGNFGHAGRPGKRGGSAPGKGGGVPQAVDPTVERRGRLTERVRLITRYTQLAGYSTSEPTEKQVTTIVDLLERHSDEAIAGIDHIQIVNPRSWDDYCVRERVGLNTGAFFDPRRRSIHIASSLRKTYFDHEVGHALFATSRSRGRWNQLFRESKTFDRATRYSRKNPSEGFAESYMSFISTGGVAKSARLKNVYKAVANVVQGGRHALWQAGIHPK